MFCELKESTGFSGWDGRYTYGLLMMPRTKEKTLLKTKCMIFCLMLLDNMWGTQTQCNKVQFMVASSCCGKAAVQQLSESL